MLLDPIISLISTHPTRVKGSGRFIQFLAKLVLETQLLFGFFNNRKELLGLQFVIGAERASTNSGCFEDNGTDL